MTELGDAHHDVRARYRSMNEARSALLALERKGVDASAIEVRGEGAEDAKRPITNDEQRHADMHLEQDLEKRGGLGFVLGAVVGVLAGGTTGWLIAGDVAGGAIAGGALAGGVFCGAIGALWGGFSGLAADEAFGDTYAADADDGSETVVVVHADDDYQAVVATLRGTNPLELQVA